jgi:hypothetical protein
MDEGLSPRAQEPRRPLDTAGQRGLAALPTDGSRDSLALQVLSTEHFSLLTHRSLAYNEAFTRVGMFLTFLSMSFVAMALLSGAMPIGADFLVIATVVLGFDFVIGVTTLVRVGNANLEDLHAVHGMARIRHGYVELAPETKPYFTSPTNDDMASVLRAYGTADPVSIRANIIYGLSTSGGMLSLVVSLVAGAFGAVAALVLGVAGGVAFVIGAALAVLCFVVNMRWALGRAIRNRRSLVVNFPALAGDAGD